MATSRQKCFRGQMNPEQERCLQETKAFLLEEIVCKEIVPHLVSGFILDKNDEEYILQADTNRDQNDRLLYRLTMRSPKGFEAFVEALKVTGHERAFQKITETLKSQMGKSAQATDATLAQDEVGEDHAHEESGLPSDSADNDGNVAQDRLKKRVDNLDERVCVLEGRGGDKAAEVARLTEALKAARDKLEKILQENSTLNNQMKNLQDKNLKMSGQLTDLANKNTVLSNKVTELHGQNRKLSEQVADLQTAKGHLSKDLQQASERIDDLNECIQKLEEEKNDLQKEVEAQIQNFAEAQRAGEKEILKLSKQVNAENRMLEEFKLEQEKHNRKMEKALESQKEQAAKQEQRNRQLEKVVLQLQRDQAMQRPPTKAGPPKGKLTATARTSKLGPKVNFPPIAK